MQIHISKWRASTSLGWLKMIWALFEHFTRRLIYYEHDSQILIAIRYSTTECKTRGSSVSIIKNKRTHVLSRLKACNYLIFRRKGRSRLRLDRPFSEILDNYRLLTFTYTFYYPKFNKLPYLGFTIYHFPSMFYCYFTLFTAEIIN